MLSLPSSSDKWKLSKNDILNSIRAGIVVILGALSTVAAAFLAGALGVLQGGVTLQDIQNPKVLIATIVVAGFTSVVDLVRRWANDYSSQPVTVTIP